MTLWTRTSFIWKPGFESWPLHFPSNLLLSLRQWCHLKCSIPCYLHGLLASALPSLSWCGHLESEPTIEYLYICLCLYLSINWKQINFKITKRISLDNESEESITLNELREMFHFWNCKAWLGWLWHLINTMRCITTLAPAGGARSHGGAQCNWSTQDKDLA